MTAAPLAAGAPNLDKYEVLEEIGHGGMATVYRARDPRLGRDVAVKVIHKHLRENAEVATRFVAEARAAAKLRHRGIVEVFDVSNEEDDERFLVVELLRGTTLRKILQQHRDMPAEVGAAMVLELCEALEHAHESGIIHRDVKPENVLVELPADRAAVGRWTPKPAKRAALVAAEESEAGRGLLEPPSSSADSGKKSGKSGDAGVVIKLTDFGIAKILDAQGVTSTGQVLGSPAHMAPEQIEGGDVDARTDVFALGVLMYECLVGHLPFEGKNPAQVLRRVLDGTYPPADRERASVGGRWAKILAGALARDRAARTPTAAALGEQIRSELEALAVGEPRDVVNGYFADPAGYAVELVKRLVPRLVARGEAARKQGDVPGAAADYNRALALAPGDLAILRRVTSLTSSESRRALARRLGAILGGSIAIGLLTFGVVRWMRAHPASPGGGEPSVRVATASIDPPAAPTADPGASAAASASAARVDGAKHPPMILRIPLSSLPSASAVAVSIGGAGTRMVLLNASPKSASVLLDGQPADAFGGKPVSLSVGPHSIQASVPNSKCCKAFSGTESVKPAPPDKPDDVQRITVQLTMNPTTVSLVGAPPGGELRCSGAGLTVGAGANVSVTLKNPEWSGICEFKAEGPGRRGPVKLQAGETIVVPWPAGE